MVAALDRGEIRVAEVVDGRVVVNEAAKHAILMWFRVNDMETVEVGPFEYVDKLPLKHGYQDAGVRVVPGASARFGAFLAPAVVMMPSYVNIGAYVDEGTMVDTWATVGFVRADRQAGPPLGRRRDRRRARTAAGGAGRRRGRLLHRIPLHDRRRRTRAAGRQARCGRDRHVVRRR